MTIADYPDTARIATLVVLWGFVAIVAAIAVATASRSLLPGHHRDRRDDDRVLLAYLDKLSLLSTEVARSTQLGLYRTERSLARLIAAGRIETYPRQPLSRICWYTLTEAGGEAVRDIERARIETALSDRHGA